MTTPAARPVGKRRPLDGPPPEAELAARDPVYAMPPGLAAQGPDWLCVGAQKAGTTWLHFNLRYHPLVWLPAIKEIAFFSSHYIPEWLPDDTAHRRRQVARLLERGVVTPEQPAFAHLAAGAAEALPDEAWYRGIFAHRAPDQLGGEISPQYAVLPRAGIRHALAINPRLRVIVLLRDPIARALSAAKVRAGPGADSAAVLATFKGRHWQRAYAYSDYAQWVARWRGMLPPDQLLIEYVGRIAREPEAVMRRICDFLGLPFRVELFPELARPQFAGPEGSDRLAEARAEIARRMVGIEAAIAAEMPDIAAGLREFG